MTSEQQRKLGAYYTPEQVTDCLSSWAIRDSNDRILEPSFGGCNFLTSSIKVLDKLGAEKPCETIFGFDIDSAAFEILQQKKLDSPNFIFEDFLYSNRENYIKVNVILGNPPYLPIHKLNKTYKLNLFHKFHKHKFKIPKRSSLWIYFIVHSFQYLDMGGRMAWVVPDSIAFTNYGKSFLKQLGSYFTSVVTIRIEERYFAQEGTKEKTSFLLCEGFGMGRSDPQELRFEYLSDALEAVSNLTTASTSLGSQNVNRSKENPTVFGDNFMLTKLGDVFVIKIGIVIGATSLLTFNQQDAEKTLFHPLYTYPIITKGKQLSGLSISIKKLISIKSHLPLYLIDGIKLEQQNSELFTELVKNIPGSVLSNPTFRKRNKLFGYDDYQHPDAFLTFYAQGLPKFVVNQDRELNCTNSVHRLYLKEGYDPILMKFIAIQNFCGFFADEIRELARPYGDTISKFEPSDANKIPVIIPVSIDANFRERVEECVSAIENKLESGEVNLAEKIALSLIEKFVS